MSRTRRTKAIVVALAVLATGTLVQATASRPSRLGRRSAGAHTRTHDAAARSADRGSGLPGAEQPQLAASPVRVAARPAHVAARPAHVAATPARGRPPARHRAAPRHPRRPARRVVPVRHSHAVVVTAGHYLRSLNGGRYDRPRMYWLGAQDARRNAGGRHVVLLDIGGQLRTGVYLSTTHRFLGYRRLTGDLAAYLDGYHSRQWRQAPVTIAVGTNNDLLTSAEAGRAWAVQVVNPLIGYAARYPDMTVIGADDIEPGFGAGVPATRSWVGGYLAATRAPLLDNGSADGCSARAAFSRCGNGWSAGDVAWFAGSAAPGRILVLPQIYNPTMAGQWAQIARTARLSHRPAPQIVGVLTENAACAGDPTCPTMNSRAAWLTLCQDLVRARGAPRDMSAIVDLDVR